MVSVRRKGHIRAVAILSFGKDESQRRAIVTRLRASGLFGVMIRVFRERNRILVGDSPGRKVTSGTGKTLANPIGSQETKA
jgi:hypothetical protein